LLLVFATVTKSINNALLSVRMLFVT